jgi:RHS repeat-associated protein
MGTANDYCDVEALAAEFDFGQAYAENDTIGITHRYTGHDWDATANLYFAPYRFYNPQLARWMSRDPLGMVDGPNVYAYVNGMPVGGIDPLGLYGMVPPGTGAEGMPVELQQVWNPYSYSAEGESETVFVKMDVKDVVGRHQQTKRNVRMP